MSYEEFAEKTFAETNFQAETVDALLNEFIELGEPEAEAIAIGAFENFKDKKQTEGERISDAQREDYK